MYAFPLLILICFLDEKVEKSFPSLWPAGVAASGAAAAASGAAAVASAAAAVSADKCTLVIIATTATKDEEKCKLVGRMRPWLASCG